MIRNSLKKWVSLLLCLNVGCATFHECIIDQEIRVRNHVLAQKAWGEWSWCYDELDEPFHFAKGFKAGYRDILEGGKGCQPTLPPQCYWKPHYQSPAGRCKINAWFDGFSHGALAAQQDGFGSLQEIPMSPGARMNLEAANTPQGFNPDIGMQGIPGPVPDQMPHAVPAVPPAEAPPVDLPHAMIQQQPVPPKLNVVTVSQEYGQYVDSAAEPLMDQGFVPAPVP
jgi:hypothetical protein